MFERFTPTSRRIVVLAQEEARMLNHNYIGTEHLLLGILHDGKNSAAQTLNRRGADIEAVRTAVQDIIGLGQSEQSGHIPFTPRAREALNQAVKEALELGHSVTEDHLLLGTMLAGETTGVASKALAQLGIQAEDIAVDVKTRLTAEGHTDEEAGTPVFEALSAFQRTLGADLDVPYPALKAAMTEALRAAQAAAVGLTRAA
ncbi:Clp protease N-terminal domain-containing protein [Arthrobacter sp. IK3]|uniref:Clp protease N-terminal domain-containing protein n=1 Tax=Arthrobacter sp. IK3 TaxID=3448169 RepID=UPI003EE19028